MTPVATQPVAADAVVVTHAAIRHHPAEPLFTEDDALCALKSIEAAPFGLPVRFASDATVTFRRSGHIRSSATRRSSSPRRALATGGRVLHHLVDHLPDSRDTVVLQGFQVAGTRDWELATRARQVKIFGEYIDVRAEIVLLEGFSVHADQAELVGWLATAPCPPRTRFVVHGEPAASAGLADEIRRRLGWRATVPSDDELVLLGRRPTKPEGVSTCLS